LRRQVARFFLGLALIFQGLAMKIDIEVVGEFLQDKYLSSHKLKRGMKDLLTDFDEDTEYIA